MSETLIDKPKSVLPKKNKGKSENLKQRAYLNSLTSIIDFAAGQITGFIINPFIVGPVGMQPYVADARMTLSTGSEHHD